MSDGQMISGGASMVMVRVSCFLASPIRSSPGSG
jgi:hypothetical protein